MQEYYDHNNGDFRMANIEIIGSFSHNPLFQCVKQKSISYLNARPIQPLPEK